MRYVGDKNSVGWFYESGTYASAGSAALSTTQSFGLVQESTMDEAREVAHIRYLAGDTRDVNKFVSTTEDYTGTVRYYPQDLKMFVYALGSGVDGGSPSPYTHSISASNSDDGNAFTSGAKSPFMSFTVEDVQRYVAGQSHQRKIFGCMVNTFTLSAAQGEPLNGEVAYIGQSMTVGSFLGSTVSPSSLRPFLWADTQVHIGSGTVYDEVKDWNLTVNNNLDVQHYANGSVVISMPQPINRDYELTMTMDGNSTRRKALQETYFDGGSTFNVLIPIQCTDAGTGSRDYFISMSGCKMIDIDSPSSVEGLDEWSLTIHPETMTVSGADLIQRYNPW